MWWTRSRRPGGRERDEAAVGRALRLVPDRATIAAMPTAKTTPFDLHRRTATILVINHLLDEGRSITIEQVHAKIANGSIFGYLQSMFDSPMAWDVINLATQEALLAEWRSMVTEQSDRKTYLCENNGLCLLVAYTVEGIQLAVPLDR